MLFQFSFMHATKRLLERQISTNAVLSLSPLIIHPTNATDRAARRYGFVVAFYRGSPSFPTKRKRICTQQRLGSFTGFDPITGNTSDLDTTEPLLGKDSLSVKMLRFENQFRMLSKLQATIELNALLYFWYKNLPSHSYIPTTRSSKSVKEMIEWVESMRPELEPNLSTYQTLLDAYMKRIEHVHIAEVILDHMLEDLLKKRREAMSSADTHNVQFDDSLEVKSVLYSFHKIMTIYGKKNNSYAAEKLLRKLEKNSHEYKVPILSSETYNIAVSAWARNGKPREAEHILYSMLNVREKTLKCTGTKIVPTKEIFDACLNAWVSYPSPSSGERSELLVLKMLQLSEAGCDTKPNYKSYSKIVHAWANSRNDHAMARVDKIMETMERMDWSSDADTVHLPEQVAQTYLAAMKLCSFRVRSNWAVKKCVDYLSRLDKALGLQNVEHATLQLVYAALIYTYAQSELDETETRVDEIFSEMEVRHKKYVDEKLASKAGDEEDFYPYLSMYFYRAVLHAFAKTGSGHKAETLLKRMMHEYLDWINKHPTDSGNMHKIDISCVNSVLLAWSRSTETDAGHHAEKLFRQIYQSQNATHMNIRMDVVSYNAVLTAMSGSTDIDVARRGDAYFRQTLESNDPSCQASAVTYTKAISLWSKIGTSEAITRADELLNEMKVSKNLKPSKHTYLAYKDVLRKCKACLPPQDYDDRLREINQMIKKL